MDLRTVSSKREADLQTFFENKEAPDKPINKIEMLSRRISEIRDSGATRLTHKTITDCAEMIDERYSLLSQLLIPNGIFNNKENKVSESVLSSFIDRLTMAANLLLDHSPKNLENLGIAGSSTLFLGAYVSSNFTSSKDFKTILELLPKESKYPVEDVQSRFLKLLDQFQIISSEVSVLLSEQGKRHKNVKEFVKKQWLEMYGKYPELIFPLGWMIERENTISSHLFLAHIEKQSSRIHLINTFPYDGQGYEKIDGEIYKQNCSLSYSAKNIDHVAKHVFETVDTLTKVHKCKKVDDEKLLQTNINKVKKVCQKTPLQENPLSKITLPFGYSCTAAVYQALFQSMLQHKCQQSNLKISDSLSEFPGVWMLGLKMYVLVHFQSEVMSLGKEHFGVILDSLSRQIEKLQSLEMHAHFNNKLVEILAAYNSGNLCIPK